MRHLSSTNHINRTCTGFRPFIVVTLILTLGLAGCATNPYTGEQEASKTAKGAGLGALAGAIAGVIAGDSRKSTLIGAGIGALAGGAVGYYMDQQESKLRAKLQNSGVSVTRNGNNIILNMPGNVTFATNSSNISANFYEVLSSVALVINEFEKTYVDITGHTDSTGADSYNMQLSVARASSVSSYFRSQGVVSQRIFAQGLGETQPIANNDTAQGRTQNRRVEIVLTPVT